MDDPTRSRTALSRHCRRCNYDLSGLPSPGVCPECGTTYGNELVVEGMQTKRESMTAIITAFILMLLLAGVGFVLVDGCCSLSLLSIAILILVSKLLKERTRQALGYDLRWIITEEGIQVIRGEQSQIPLLEWSGIKDVHCTRSNGPFTRQWSRLTIDRQFHSFDLFRTRGQDLWINGLSATDRLRLRRAVLKYRDQAST